VAPTIIPVVKLSMPPVIVPVTLAMVAMVSLVVFSMRFPVLVEMVTPVVAVAGMPPGRMFAAVVIMRVGMKITAVQDNRVCTIGMDGRRATQQQTRGEQGRLKQGTGFHESDSFFRLSQDAVTRSRCFG